MRYILQTATRQNLKALGAENIEPNITENKEMIAARVVKADIYEQWATEIIQANKMSDKDVRKFIDGL